MMDIFRNVESKNLYGQDSGRILELYVDCSERWIDMIAKYGAKLRWLGTLRGQLRLKVEAFDSGKPDD